VIEIDRDPDPDFDGTIIARIRRLAQAQTPGDGEILDHAQIVSAFAP